MLNRSILLWSFHIFLSHMSRSRSQSCRCLIIRYWLSQVDSYHVEQQQRRAQMSLKSHRSPPLFSTWFWVLLGVIPSLSILFLVSHGCFQYKVNRWHFGSLPKTIYKIFLLKNDMVGESFDRTIWLLVLSDIFLAIDIDLRMLIEFLTRFFFHNTFIDIFLSLLFL